MPKLPQLQCACWLRLRQWAGEAMLGIVQRMHIVQGSERLLSCPFLEK